MKILDLELARGDRIPFGWGIAWAMPNQLAYVVLPMPLHVIAGFVRRVWHEFLLGYHGEASVQDAAFTEGYLAGVRSAQTQAWRDGCEHGETRAFKLMASLHEKRK